MRLVKARVCNYRSILDTGWFDIEDAKTILVGPNEAGKTAVLLALQALNPAEGKSQFDWLRDFPRSRLSDIQKGAVKQSEVTVVEGQFELDTADQQVISANLPELKEVKTFTVGRRLDNTRWNRLDGGPAIPKYGDLKQDLARMTAHMKGRAPDDVKANLEEITAEWDDDLLMNGEPAEQLRNWLDATVAYIDESNSTEDNRHDRLAGQIAVWKARNAALKALTNRMPVFVYFSNYYQVRPTIHLKHLAQRLKSGVLDDESYDFGNKCLLQLLGFTANPESTEGHRWTA